jgi:flagellar biosynthesis/type III secretory pathway protein FliH
LRPQKKPPEGGFFHAIVKIYLAAAEAAPLAASTATAASEAAAEAEEAAAEAEETAAEAAEAGASAGTATGATTTGAGAGAGASVLPQAARAMAATIAARTRDLFIFTILDELKNSLLKIIAIVKKTIGIKFQAIYDQWSGGLPPFTRFQIICGITQA